MENLSAVNDLVIIGAGKMRTGTTSLKQALEILLKEPCYHMKEVHKNPGSVKLWIKAVENDGLTDEEWKHIFSGYRATVDYPACTFYKDLLRVYPNAKVILSIREPHSWVRSVRETVAYAVEEVQKFPLNIMGYFTRIPEMMHKTSERYISMHLIKTDEEFAVKRFNNWTNEVKQNVPADRLLVFQANEGWEPLCQFLRLPIPSVPYPHANKSGNIQNIVLTMKIVCYTVIIGVPLLVSGVVYRWMLT